jgi:hypothetical protein
MNVWKPIAIGLAAALAASIGMQTASATKDPDPRPNVTGPCHDQVNMAAALASLQAAQGSLGRAEHNKGNWRTNAAGATATAITETNRGCGFANDH